MGGNSCLTHRVKRRQAGRTPRGARTAHPGSGASDPARLGEDRSPLPQAHACSLPRRPGRTGTPAQTRSRSWRSGRSRHSTAGPRHSPSGWPAGKSHRSEKCRAGGGAVTHFASWQPGDEQLGQAGSCSEARGPRGAPTKMRAHGVAPSRAAMTHCACRGSGGHVNVSFPSQQPHKALSPHQAGVTEVQRSRQPPM